VFLPTSEARNTQKENKEKEQIMAKAEYLKSEDYQLAFDIYTGKAIHSIDVHKETDEWTLPSYTIDPEKALLKKE
jgi:hypothetical protein